MKARILERPYLQYLLTKYRFPRSLVHRPIQQFFRTYLDAAPVGARVLDAGCGSGIDTGPYADRLRVLGVDCQHDYLAHCVRTYPRAAYVRCDVGRLALSSASVDLIILNQVIEHLADPVSAVAELSRVLASGGRLTVATPNYAGWGWPLVEATYHRLFAREFAAAENHVTHCTPELMRAYLGDVLVVERAETICANMILVGSAKRLT